VFNSNLVPSCQLTGLKLLSSPRTSWCHLPCRECMLCSGQGTPWVLWRVHLISLRSCGCPGLFECNGVVLGGPEVPRRSCVATCQRTGTLLRYSCCQSAAAVAAASRSWGRSQVALPSLLCSVRCGNLSMCVGGVKRAYSLTPCCRWLAASAGPASGLCTRFSSRQQLSHALLAPCHGAATRMASSMVDPRGAHACAAQHNGNVCMELHACSV
jgi:hypothetical protein